MTEQEYFIEACFSDDLQEFYKNWIEEKSDRSQFFYELVGNLVHKYWKPEPFCVSTKEKLTRDNIGIHVTYWNPNLWRPIRKDLAKEYRKQESYECQKIDSNCNDCGYLERIGFGKGNNVQINRCLKKDIEVFPHPNTSANNDCFIHRKDLSLSHGIHIT